MRVSTKSDYALRALIEIAHHGGEGPLSAVELGRRQAIPKGFLQTILADLRRAEILTAQRGQAGGWVLARPASSVSVADVIRAVDGPLVSVYDQRPQSVSYNDAAAALQPVWVATRQALRDVLEHVSIEHLATQDLPPAVTDRVADEDAWASH